MRKTKVVEIEYEWFEPGTRVTRKNGTPEEFIVEKCYAPTALGHRNNLNATCRLVGIGAGHLTEELEEVETENA